MTSDENDGGFLETVKSHGLHTPVKMPTVSVSQAEHML